MVISKPPRASVLRRARFALQRFLYGNANLAGLASALLGPLLLALGVIGPGWLWITAALYAIGWLLGTALTPARTAFSQALNNRFTAEELRQHLDELIDQARPLLNADMMQSLERVRSAVGEVLPALAAAGPGFDEGLFTVRETVTRYLPETLGHYAALPPLFRVSQVVHEGQTAQQILVEQLQLLDEQMQEVVRNVAAADTRALLANGRFLEQKFGQGDVFVP